jgi:hypothetical protein
MTRQLWTVSVPSSSPVAPTLIGLDVGCVIASGVHADAWYDRVADVLIQQSFFGSESGEFRESGKFNMRYRRWQHGQSREEAMLNLYIKSYLLDFT